MEFTEKFIAFIDILGFKNLVEQAETGRGIGLDRILELQNQLGEKHLSVCCPQSKSWRGDLDFRVSQVSDSVIVSSEISPAGAINLVAHCWRVVIRLLEGGIMCRGYITRGPIFHTDERYVGTGFHRAYENERNVTAFKREANERGTPFVEIDRSVCDYVRRCEDRCVNEMFSRFVTDDGAVVALFPFKRLEHQLVIGGFGRKFDPETEKRSNQNVRLMLEKLKERVMTFVDTSNRNAVAKAEHYITCLNAQIQQCDRTDEAITLLGSPFPRHPQLTNSPCHAVDQSESGE